MAIQVQLRHDTAANWLLANPVLASGEFGYETDTNKNKVGNGVQAWVALAYYGIGPIGPQGVSVANWDGGTPTSIYGGISPIDCGGPT